MDARFRQLTTVVLPIAFVAGLIAADRFVIAPWIPGWLSLLLTLAIAGVGVVTFNGIIMKRLDASQQRIITQNRQLAALDEASIVIASELSLERVLQRIVDIVRELSGARYAALGILGPDGFLTDLITSGLTPAERAAIGSLPRNHGILGTMLREGQPVRVPNLAAEPRRTGFPPNHPPMSKLMGVPIVSGSTVIGNLYLADKVDGSEFTDDDERLIVLLAAHAAVAIENARLHQQVQRLAASEERNRIARELHDGTIQSIYGVNLVLEDAQDLLRSDPAAASARLDEAIEALNAIILEIRGYIHNLRSMLEPSSLTEMIADLVASHRRTTGVDIQFSAEGQLPLDSDAPWHVLQLVREALSNIARHADAKRVAIRLARRDDAMTIVIEDDGRGFDPAAPNRVGNGLRNMRERAAAVGGALQIESAPGAGTRLVVTIPIAQGVRA
ncbi:MAG: GAF domain-containing sensor histidine kinase [Chloroflexota bacterium]|nr:GAF domain-containing sensor histidine kinase [Dehalococcoidia bacterium]MDW8254040.1 GAF domain-containing sensor histidine kinase [Chloroflexota bacterium]